MAANSAPTTQSHLDIKDVVEDMVVLRNGNLALVLETSSLNFELLAEEEQDARIISFATLLNALDFPLQIVVRTERADLNDYLERLVVQRDQHVSPALKRQLEIYIKFIKNLTTKVDILNKRFFVVITTNFSVASQNNSLLGPLLGSKPKTVTPNIQRAQDYLHPKRNFLVKQFQKIGIKAVQLNNDQLIQLYYDIYDPDKVGVGDVDLTESGYTAGLVGALQQAEEVPPTAVTGQAQVQANTTNRPQGSTLPDLGGLTEGGDPGSTSRAVGQ